VRVDHRRSKPRHVRTPCASGAAPPASAAAALFLAELHPHVRPLGRACRESWDHLRHGRPRAVRRLWCDEGNDGGDRCHEGAGAVCRAWPWLADRSAHRRFVGCRCIGVSLCPYVRVLCPRIGWHQTAMHIQLRSSLRRRCLQQHSGPASPMRSEQAWTTAYDYGNSRCLAGTDSDLATRIPCIRVSSCVRAASIAAIVSPQGHLHTDQTEQLSFVWQILKARICMRSNVVEATCCSWGVNVIRLLLWQP
jgi:hypothetical protein